MTVVFFFLLPLPFQEDAEALQKAESWKPRIMYEVAKDFGGITLYLDVSSTFGSSLSALVSSFESDGVTMLSPTLSSEISRWLPRASMAALSPTYVVLSTSRYSVYCFSLFLSTYIIDPLPPSPFFFGNEQQVDQVEVFSSSTF